VAGLRGSKGRSAYGASKGAVNVLNQVLANDLGRHGIRVNRVASGPVDTPMAQAMHSQEDRAMDAPPSDAPLRQARGDRERHRVPPRWRTQAT
jgi:NAD(P)-dependent dehydrogenase (short-subunit alcohol dehydrogenase family)